MYDRARRRGITGRTGYLTIAYENIIMRRGHRIVAELAQSPGEKRQELVKDLLRVGRRRDEGDHEVATIGVHASSPTLPLNDAHTVCRTIRLIDLLLAALMTTVDNRRINNPREECRFSNRLDHLGFERKVIFEGEILYGTS